MIPVSLQLKNFLSYGDEVPALNFNEFNVACLSGNNGHGKSAILDAMTWALWGEARKASGDKSASDGLLRIGTPEMQVKLEFDLEGDRYCVIRNYKRKGRKTRLDFQVLDEKNNTYRPLTEKTSRATQEKINATLRMNYGTFINSAFILQGRVDEFTKKTPHKRKEILAEILDLSRYDSLTDLAKEAHRDAKGDYQKVSEELEKIRQELKHKPEYEQKLRELEQQLAEIDEKLQILKTQRQTLEKHLTELQGQQTQLDDKKRQQQQLRDDLKRLEGRKTRQQKQITDVRALLKREEEIIKQYDRYVELQEQNKNYEDKLRQKTIYQAQKAEIEKKILKARHVVEKELDSRQADRTQIRKILKDVETLLQKAQVIEQGYQELQEARKQDETLEETRDKVDSLKRSLQKLDKLIEKEKNQLTVELQTRQRHVNDLQALAKQQTDREKDVQACHNAVKQLEMCEQQRKILEEEGNECNSALARLQEQQKQFQERIEETKEKRELLKRSGDTPQCPLCESKLDVHGKEKLEARFRHELQKIHDEEKRVEQEIKESTSHVNELRKRYAEFNKTFQKLKPSAEKLSLAENALQKSQEAASQLVELEKQRSTLQHKIEQREYAQEAQTKRDDIQKNITSLAYDSKEHQNLKRRVKTLQKFEREHTRLEGARERQKTEMAALPLIENEIIRLQTRLEQQDYARAEQAQLQEIQTKIGELGYDEQAHTQIQQELQQLQEVPQQKFELDEARKRIGGLEQELAEILADQQKYAESTADLEQQIGILEAELKHLPTVKQELEQVRKTLHTHNKERDELLQTQGTYQNKYEQCKQLAQENKQKAQEQKQAKKDQDMYDHLKQIFGKDGMQAYLIANAIPEIEHEANEILARLTDNRTHIAIEQVKDLQSGGTKETLDIKISDELGTRNYEMYSGGEAFRVDFAIRIALSKLLATRAGTKLKTLIIDEGFGTQDTHGLEQLVEAITAISTDFEKILVITHLEALKNAFPVRIEVVKHPDTGSHYQIVH